MKDKFDQTYLQIISQSARWQDSLGGKLVTGIGSLFKSGTKAVGTAATAAATAAADGLNKAANSSITGVKKFVKEYKTKSKILDAINNIKAIYDPNNPSKDSVKNLIENKEQIKYIIDSSKLVLPPNLLKFLQIFQTVGSDLIRLIKDNPAISSRSYEEIKALINQSLLRKVQSFKESIEATITQEVAQNIIDIYYNIIIQQLSDEGSTDESSTDENPAEDTKETESNTTSNNSTQDINLLKELVQEFNKEYNFKTVSEDKNIIKVKKTLNGSKILNFLSQNNVQLIWNQNDSNGIEEYVNKIDILVDTLTIEIKFKQNNDTISNKFRITSKLKNIDNQALSIQANGPKTDNQLDVIIKEIATSIQKMYRHTEYSSFHKIAINNGFEGNNGIYQKQFSNLDLKSKLEKYTDIYEQIDDIVMADNLLCKIKIKNSNLQIYMKSEYYAQPVIIPVPINDYLKLNENFNSILDNTLKQFYTQENAKQTSQQERQQNLNNVKKQDITKNNVAAAYNSIRGVENVLIAGNDSIDNDIKWKGGLFGIGSFKKVLREIATCKLNIDDIKYLAKVFFQISVIK